MIIDIYFKTENVNSYIELFNFYSFGFSLNHESTWNGHMKCKMNGQFVGKKHSFVSLCCTVYRSTEIYDCVNIYHQII